MQIFCNSMVWEGHSEELVLVGARCPTRSFYIMKREELEEWFPAYLEKIEQFVPIVIRQTVILVQDLNT